MEALNQTILLERLQELEKWRPEISQNLDQFYLIVLGIIIYMLQAGFAFLEAGVIRSKNTTNILMKNFMDSLFSALAYWIFGYAFAFGEGNSFLGYSHFAHYDLPDTGFAFWFYHFVFAATAATIVSGAVAERCEFIAYVVYSLFLTGFMYPVVTHWAWTSKGWLLVGHEYDIDGEIVSIGYVDFAGSGVVHILGGITAFIGAVALGPRIGRFDEDGNPVEIKGHSLPFACLGGFILVFGFFAFNASSLGHLSHVGDGALVAKMVKNTAVAGTGGAFTTLLYNRLLGNAKWSYMVALNGCLTGMVASCSSCNQLETYMAFVLGIAGGVAYLVTSWQVLRLKVDDPLDATAVHYGGGVCGVLLVPFISSDIGIFYFWNKKSALHLAWNLLGMTAIIVWTTGLSAVMFLVLKVLKVLRVPLEYELRGLDIPKHGEPAYPPQAYGHGWGGNEDSYRLVSAVKSAIDRSDDITQEMKKPDIGKDYTDGNVLMKTEDGQLSITAFLTKQAETDI